MRSHAWIAGLPALALLWGCEPTQLYVGATTVVGLNAAMNTEQTAGHLKIGYDRTFVTIVPKSVPAPEGGREAMAALSCSDLEVTGIFITGFREYLATGRAAMNYAALFNPHPEDPATGSETPVKPLAPPAPAADANSTSTGAAADAAKVAAEAAAKMANFAASEKPAKSATADRIFNCVDNAPIVPK